MDNNVESIEAASLLSGIFQKLFGGLGKLFDEAAEYEEEMGVMKQVTYIPIKPDGSDREYTLTIKLSPIKDKEGLFYVEAKTDAPNFDVSTINGQAVKLNNSNMKDFKKMIMNLIEKNKFDYNPSENTEEPADETQPAENEETLTESDKAEIKDTEKELQNRLKSSKFTAVDENNNKVTIKVEYDLESTPQVCTISTFVVDNEGNPDPNYLTTNQEFNTTYDNGDVVTPSDFWATIKEEVGKYAESNGLTNVEIKASTIVDATFIKASDTQDIELTAINASCSIRAALDIIDEVADSDEFYNMITEEDPISLRITEEADDYLIDEIDEVNTDSTYIEFFEEISKLYAQIQSLKWKVGSLEFDNCTIAYNVMWNLDDLHERSAVWAIQHNPDYNPVPQTSVAAVGEVCEVATKIGDMLIEVLEDYYVNLSHDEQKVVDDKLQEIKNAMMYV